MWVAPLWYRPFKVKKHDRATTRIWKCQVISCQPNPSVFLSQIRTFVSDPDSVRSWQAVPVILGSLGKSIMFRRGIKCCPILWQKKQKPFIFTYPSPDCVHVVVFRYVGIAPSVWRLNLLSVKISWSNNDPLADFSKHSMSTIATAQFQLGDIVAWGQAAPGDSCPAAKRQSWWLMEESYDFWWFLLEVADFIWNWFPGLTGNEEHIWIGKTRDFWEKNTDRYLGRLWLRRGIQNLIPSRCFLFVGS